MGAQHLLSYGLSPYAKEWFVHGNNGSDGYKEGNRDRPFKTMQYCFNRLQSAPRHNYGHVIWALGNVTEHIITPTGVPDVTIIGAGPNPRHADTHPLNGEDSAFTWKSAGTASALLTVRNPGWRFINVLFASHASHPALLLERNAVEDATEIDASHMQAIGCRFASGGYGIRDTGGTFNVRLYNNYFGAVTECILGVGNIGVGQLAWDIVGNRFINMTNGVKIAGHECRIRDNSFSDGGTPDTTYVLNTNNGGGRDNHVVFNTFQTADAQYSAPDLVGCATDIWRNQLKDATDKSGTPT